MFAWILHHNILQSQNALTFFSHIRLRPLREYVERSKYLL